MSDVTLATHEPQHTSSAPRPRTSWNYVNGIVLSLGDALSGRYQILTTDGGLINARDEEADCNDFKLEQPVTLKIAADDVLVAPDGLAALPEWNHWAARVVLVEPVSSGRRVTVKIIGEPWTLMSTMLLLPIDRDLRAWDAVTVLIDPDRVVLMGGGGKKSRLRRRLMTYIAQSTRSFQQTIFTLP